MRLLLGGQFNIWGIKTEAVLLLITMIFVNLIILLVIPALVKLFNLLIVVTIIDFIILLFWLIYINERLVVSNGNNYGVALLRSLDKSD